MDTRSIAYAKHISQQLNSQIKQSELLLKRSMQDLAFLNHTLSAMVRIYEYKEHKDAQKRSDHVQR
jgi:hypothetical protein